MSIGVMLFCPFTGKPRHPSDIQSDPKGILVWDGEEPLRAYTTSPQCTWVGLTDEEVRECYGHVEGVTGSEAVILMSAVHTAQAMLKGKST